MHGWGFGPRSCSAWLWAGCQIDAGTGGPLWGEGSTGGYFRGFHWHRVLLVFIFLLFVVAVEGSLWHRGGTGGRATTVVIKITWKKGTKKERKKEEMRQKENTKQS